MDWEKFGYILNANTGKNYLENFFVLRYACLWMFIHQWLLVMFSKLS